MPECDWVLLCAYLYVAADNYGLGWLPVTLSEPCKGGSRRSGRMVPWGWHPKHSVARANDQCARLAQIGFLPTNEGSFNGINVLAGFDSEVGEGISIDPDSLGREIMAGRLVHYDEHFRAGPDEGALVLSLRQTEDRPAFDFVHSGLPACIGGLCKWLLPEVRVCVIALDRQRPMSRLILRLWRLHGRLMREAAGAGIERPAELDRVLSRLMQAIRHRRIRKRQPNLDLLEQIVTNAEARCCDLRRSEARQILQAFVSPHRRMSNAITLSSAPFDRFFYAAGGGMVGRLRRVVRVMGDFLRAAPFELLELRRFGSRLDDPDSRLAIHKRARAGVNKKSATATEWWHLALKLSRRVVGCEDRTRHTLGRTSQITVMLPVDEPSLRDPSSPISAGSPFRSASANAYTELGVCGNAALLLESLRQQMISHERWLGRKLTALEAFLPGRVHVPIRALQPLLKKKTKREQSYVTILSVLPVSIVCSAFECDQPSQEAVMAFVADLRRRAQEMLDQCNASQSARRSVAHYFNDPIMVAAEAIEALRTAGTVSGGLATAVVLDLSVLIARHGG